MKRIGVLTGGGDCPGLNAVIAGIVRKALVLDWEVVGIMHGWKGLLEKITMPLDRQAISGIMHRGGTIIRTSRTNPCKSEELMDQATRNFKQMGLDALVAIGGDDTLGAANQLYERGLAIVGVPKTIDNDISGTDRTFGFDTAVNIAMDAIDKLHTTAESHSRVLVVEIMGRHAGWITLHAGMAGGADVTLIPEVQMTVDEVCGIIKKRHAGGKNYSIVAVSEGAKLGGEEMIIKDLPKDEFGNVILGGIADRLAKIIQKETGIETRSVVLGHLQRGGSPSALDRYIGLRFGVKAVELVEQGDFGKMVALRGNDFIPITIKEAVSVNRTVEPELYEIAKLFFG